MPTENHHAHREHRAAHASTHSKVGAPNLFDGDDQRTIPDSEVERVTRESGHNLEGYMSHHHGNHHASAFCSLPTLAPPSELCMSC